MKKNQLISLAKFAMRNSIYQILVILIFTCGAFAKDVEAQDFLNKHISIKADRLDIKSIIEKAENLTNVKFVYSPKLINSDRKISINIVNQKLKYFLENSLKSYDVGYRIFKDQILLYSTLPINQPEYAPVTLFDGTVTGKVTDSKGEPIPGVSVTVKGKSIGTTTDLTGSFVLKGLTADSRVLIVRYVGFISKEVNLSGGNADETINISLSEDNLQLESVMVTGGNPKKKLESSVALTSVSNKDITNRAPLNSTDLLKAIPGLTVESTGGDGPGNVWVRGFPQQGGYIFLGIQEDGLPLLPTGFNTNPSIDQYYKTDLTIQNIEAIRGGNASIIQANTPGAVVNNISYTGADK